MIGNIQRNMPVNLPLYQMELKMSKNNKMAHKKREKRTVSSEILCAHIKNLKFSLLEEKKLLFMTVNNYGSIFVKIDRKCIDVK